MEVMGELAAGGSLPWAVLTAAFDVVPPSVRSLRSIPSATADGGGSGGLFRCLELLRSAGSTAVADAALLDFGEAVDFAANVEEISRAAEFLQVVAAGAVDRTRRQALMAGSGSGTGSADVVGWTTGWGGACQVLCVREVQAHRFR